MDAEESFILDVTPTDGTFDTDFLERLGHPVLVCHGPDWGAVCPILNGSCAMVVAASRFGSCAVAREWTKTRVCLSTVDGGETRERLLVHSRS